MKYVEHFWLFVGKKNQKLQREPQMLKFGSKPSLLNADIVNKNEYNDKKFKASF